LRIRGERDGEGQGCSRAFIGVEGALGRDGWAIMVDG
jgi:hypothetical protein